MLIKRELVETQEVVQIHLILYMLATFTYVDRYAICHEPHCIMNQI